MSVDSAEGVNTDSGYETLSPIHLSKDTITLKTEILHNEGIEEVNCSKFTENKENTHAEATFCVNNTITNENKIDEIVNEYLSNGTDQKTTRLSKKYMKRKCKLIGKALEENDLEKLKCECISPGGLINDDIRKVVWPKLLGVDIIETSPRPTLKEIEEHPYYHQVVLDVNRSLQRFPPSIAESQRLTMLDQLVFLIMRVLCRHPHLHYYQGYHDICVTFLLVLGEEISFHVLEKLSRTHLKVFMEETMEPTIHLLEHMYTLMDYENLPLKNFLLKSDVGVAYCLSWLITWFGHVLNDYNDVVRLFDLFIVCHSWMPLYLTTAIVIYREKGIMQQDCDMASVHSFLSRIPNDLPFEELIVKANKLFKNHNPKALSYARPYVESKKISKRRGWWFLRTVSETIKANVPGTNFTMPLVIAAAVLATAVLYQAYKY